MTEIINAATEMFYEHGYEGTSIESVAEAVGILKGSLYYYIDSKEDLLFRVVDEVQRDTHKLLAEATGDTATPPLERLSGFARRQVEYNARNVKLVAVYHTDWRRLKGDRLADIRRRRQHESRVVVALLEEAKERGDVAATVDAKLAASCVLATIIWPHAWYRGGGTTSPERLADFYASYVLHGVAGAG
ncbi:MAG: TetR/AcrR family transcriptional regulator [Thermoleophilaceae bacterium]